MNSMMSMGNKLNVEQFQEIVNTGISIMSIEIS